VSTSFALTEPVAAHRIRTGQWRRAGAAVFCSAWGGNQFTPLLLMYRHVGGYSTVTVDLFLGAYVAGLAPGLLIAGPASDVHGRRRVMVVGTALSLLGSLVLALGATGPLPLYLGRLISGAAVGIAMSVGTSWIKELSTAPHDRRADVGAGARRASLAVTLGFGLGGGVAGALAQWTPWPTVLPYLAHVAIGVPVLIGAIRGTETRAPQRIAALRSRLRVPIAGHRRFLRVVLPMAPWIFGSAGVAYAVMPQLTAGRVGHWQLAYATLVTVCTPAAGALVQPLAKRLDSVGTARAVLAAMVVMSVGMAVSAVDAQLRLPWLGVVVAVVLGAGYGIALVSGLLEIQRICADSDTGDLAGLTGVYYALAYSGFLLPVLLATLSHLLSYPLLLAALSGCALACTGVVGVSSRRDLPVTATDTR
jgi:MFS family permease